MTALPGEERLNGIRPQPARVTAEMYEKMALAAGARQGLALAGGYAVSAHGTGSRPSGGVGLSTSWQHRGEFSDAERSALPTEEATYDLTIVPSDLPKADIGSRT